MSDLRAVVKDAADELGNLIPPGAELATAQGAETPDGGTRREVRTDHEYDAGGRLTRTRRRTLPGGVKQWTYTWDADDRLTAVSLPDGTPWHYTYDPLGRRIAKQATGPDGSSKEQVRFSWDGARLAEAETGRPDATVTTLTWDYQLGTYSPATQIRRSRAADASQAEIDAEFHAIVTDMVGTPTELVSAEGEIAWHTTNTVWGRTIDAPGSTTTCLLRFPGQYHDDETGLHYNQQRYYDPDTASYLSPDPLGLEPSPNPRS